MEKSKFKKMIEQGCIAEWYTLNGYFLKIYPAFEIDKVKFSFVMKGKQGAGFDVYVDTEDFSLLCDDIKNFRMMKLIERDTGQYPSAWKYATGENGALSVAIGKSQKGGVVIQGKDGNKKVNAFVPLTCYNDLRKMAVLYDLVSGKVPATRYYADIVEQFWSRPDWRDNQDKAPGNKDQRNANNQKQGARYGNNAQKSGQQVGYGRNAAQQQNVHYNASAPQQKVNNNSTPQQRGQYSGKTQQQSYNRSGNGAPQQPVFPPPPPGINELDIPFNEMSNYGTGITL